MIHEQHADAAARRLTAVIELRHELAQLAEKPEKDPAEWARISELRLQLQLAYDGAAVHSQLALYGVLGDLTAALGRLSETSARELVRQLVDVTAADDRTGQPPDERRRSAQAAAARAAGQRDRQA